MTNKKSRNVPYIDNLKSQWNKLGEKDPLWAILTDKDKKGNKWDENEFFATGALQIDELFHYLEKLNLLPHKGRALEFGCGVGRLTRPLGRHFKECYGVDISPSMIRLAKELNATESNCKFLVNDKGDLSIFGGEYFDFIYSNIVLQHMKPKYALTYISEMVRTLKPAGLAVFQLPCGPKMFQTFIRSRLPNLWRTYVWLRHKQQLEMEMHYVRRPKVEQAVHGCGGRIVHIRTSESAGSGYYSYEYFVTKDEKQ